ncbi:MAG TPA: serine/threonine protein kinase [Candidatus Phocaeicola excrementigallinarum]|mgnify:CR=1 FL=1|nr:serine/threonine protein kinase [Candidatus Phocaeicola excrementigallinarum]
MEENKLFHNRYFLERLLGRGNFSEVWLAKDVQTDIEVALKIYAPATGLDDHGLNVFAREFSLVVNANHKNLLKPLYYDSCDRKPYLVLPFCKEGSISKGIGNLSEQEAWRLLRDVASGLAWLHSMNPPVIHQDIKPDNIMVGENGDYMITDFGVSTHLKSTLRKSLSLAFSSAGTVAYMAPERFGKDNTPIMANDIYSLGATVYEMLTGETPFGDDGGLMQKKGAELPEIKGDFSPQLKKVVSACLCMNPWERPTAEQLERYAEAGLKGLPVRFDNEKTFWQKHRTLISALIVLVIIGAGIGVIAYSNHAATVAEQRQIRITAHYNDSIQSVITDYISTADTLVARGNEKDENYERMYIEALSNYRKAMEEYNQLKMDKSAVQPMMERLDIKISGLEKQLQEAYISLSEKAEIFKNEPEILEEFKARLSVISKAVYIHNDSLISTKTIQ